MGGGSLYEESPCCVKALRSPAYGWSAKGTLDAEAHLLPGHISQGADLQGTVLGGELGGNGAARPTPQP